MLFLVEYFSLYYWHSNNKHYIFTTTQLQYLHNNPYDQISGTRGKNNYKYISWNIKGHFCWNFEKLMKLKEINNMKLIVHDFFYKNLWHTSLFNSKVCWVYSTFSWDCFSKIYKNVLIYVCSSLMENNVRKIVAIYLLYKWIFENHIHLV